MSINQLSTHKLDGDAPKEKNLQSTFSTVPGNSDENYSLSNLSRVWTEEALAGKDEMTTSIPIRFQGRLLIFSEMLM